MEIVQSKLSVYEENPGLSKFTRGNELTDFEKVGIEDL